ncbi:MAG: hypothetical protein JWO06_3298 [Bacteroidota bacterium]|nr:hypothetical protein [Bacteroidota bacterium]
MKTKIYLVVLLLIIMGAGGRTMFEIAYHGMAFEHGSTPNADTYPLIFLALWYVVMMVLDVILLRNKDLKARYLFIGLVSVGVFVPAIYMFMTK